MSNGKRVQRILAIDFTSRGFGYALFEGHPNLIDWGTTQLKAAEKLRCIFQIRKMIQRCRPAVLALEDPKGSRRCSRIKRLIDSIRSLSVQYHIKARCFSRRQVREYFSRYKARTKHQIAIAISDQFPELKPQLPRYRRPWMSEDERMSIFNATSFALTYFNHGTMKH